jgi:hypothetical protein
MTEPTNYELERAIAALLPFVREWELPLRPGDVDAIAHAVLTHARGTSTHAEIDATVHAWIDADRRAHDHMVAVLARCG